MPPALKFFVILTVPLVAISLLPATECLALFATGLSLYFVLVVRRRGGSALTSAVCLASRRFSRVRHRRVVWRLPAIIPGYRQNNLVDEPLQGARSGFLLLRRA